MKTKTPKEPKPGAAVALKDLEPKKNPKAGADKQEANLDSKNKIRSLQEALE